MGIPPITEFLIPSEILSSDVKSSYKTDSSVNNNDFSVIPVIHTKLQLPKQRREEFRNLNSFFFEALPVTVFHRSASHTVKKDTNFHAFSRFLNKYLLYFLPQFIVADNVILHVDISLRLLHLFYKRTELLFSVRINANIVIICQNRFPGFQIIKNQIFKP